MGAAPGEHWRGSRSGCGSDVYGCRISKRCDCFLLHAPVAARAWFPCLAVQRKKIRLRPGRNYCDSARINCASRCDFFGCSLVSLPSVAVTETSTVEDPHTEYLRGRLGAHFAPAGGARPRTNAVEQRRCPIAGPSRPLLLWFPRIPYLRAWIERMPG